LTHCQDATEAELCALEEGLKLALQWSNLNFLVETDSAEALELLKEATLNLSAYAFRVNAIRDMMQERSTRIAKIGREANVVSHELARIGRVQNRTEFWLASAPPEIAKAIEHDRNSILIYYIVIPPAKKRTMMLTTTSASFLKNLPVNCIPLSILLEEQYCLSIIQQPTK
jgi:hypothetical protein